MRDFGIVAMLCVVATAAAPASPAPEPQVVTAKSTVDLAACVAGAPDRNRHSDPTGPKVEGVNQCV